jgi:hypothetical protein
MSKVVNGVSLTVISGKCTQVNDFVTLCACRRSKDGQHQTRKEESFGPKFSAGKFGDFVLHGFLHRMQLNGQAAANRMNIEVRNRVLFLE